MCGEEVAGNARRCPSCGEEFLHGKPTDVDSLRPTIIDVGDVVSTAWGIFTKEWGILLGAVVVANLCTGMSQVPSEIMQIALREGGFQGIEFVGFLLIFGCSIASGLFQIFILVGQTMLFLKVARGEEASIGDLFTGGSFFVRMVLRTIVVAAVTIAGYLACIIPGIIVSLMLWPYANVLVDTNAPGIDCLKGAKAITSGNWGNGFLLMLISFGFIVLGVLACFVGLFVAIPLVTMMFTVAYLKMSGQHVTPT
jgi:hypothetical protein